MNWSEVLSSWSQNPFYEFAIILILATVLGALGQILRQPLIVMFIALGVVVGPAVLDVVHSKENIHLLSEVGIAILLFIVGLKLDLRLIKSTGKIALLTGLGQVVFTSVIGYFIGLSLGFSSLHSFYIAVALTFSSTIIIVKLLSDKKEIDALHGQISIGFLIVQDMVVILVMIILSALGNKTDDSLVSEVFKTIAYSLLLVGFTLVVMRWAIPVVSFFLAKSQELLALFAIAWAVGLASAADFIGFSGEVGAFLAGVSLASSPFKDSISSRLISLRDFLLLFFFVNLGANLNLEVIGNQIPSAMVFSAFVLIGNPIIVLIIMGLMGYRKRTSFLAGLTVAQISEFSLIFAGLGLQIGHLTEETVGLITLVGLITIGLSTYLILYSHQIYKFIAPVLSIFERNGLNKEAGLESKTNEEYDVIILGLGRFGGKVAEYIEEHPNVKYLGIDFDPNIVREWNKQGKPIIYGDISDPELFDHIYLDNVSCILSTIPERDFSAQFIALLREKGYQGAIYLTALQEQDAEILKDCHADQVLIPHSMAAENFYNSHLSRILKDKA